MHSGKYRPDVDGLRAISVLCVVAFHAFSKWIPGGFVGVDVFFTISGYLITGLLLDELAHGKIEFWDFYSRRIRRIGPPLLLVASFSFVVGWISLLPHEYKDLGAIGFGGVGFHANQVLSNQGGYFNFRAEYKPLLHLWSLSIEEQFYLAWPLLLLSSHRLRLSIPFLVIVTAASLIYAIDLLPQEPIHAFYFARSRIWEISAGALVQVVLRRVRHEPPEIIRHIASVVGLGSILIMSCWFDSRRPFPGGWALVPVTGSLLIIAAGPSAVANRLLASRPFVFVGLISYSLYLWHWTLLSFGQIFQTWQFTPGRRAIVCVVATGLAVLTHRYVELPARRMQPRRRATAFAVLLFASGSILLVIAGRIEDGTLAPRTAQVQAFAEITRAIDDWSLPPATFKGSTEGTVVMVGDSHCEQYWPRLYHVASTATTATYSIERLTFGGCAPIPNVDSSGSQSCSKFLATVRERIAKPDVKTVVLTMSWLSLTLPLRVFSNDPYGPVIDVMGPSGDRMLQSFKTMLEEWKVQGKEVVVLSSSPLGSELDPSSSLTRLWGWPTEVKRGAVARAVIERRTRAIDDRVRPYIESSGATLMNPVDWLCGAGTCPIVDEQGHAIMKDVGHLRTSFVKRMPMGIETLIFPNRTPVNKTAPSTEVP